MYAVYGLDEAQESIEVFIGYVPASFFEEFTEPSLWTVKTIQLPDGRQKVGRLCGRAFFVHAANLKADRSVIAKYLHPAAATDIDHP